MERWEGRVAVVTGASSGIGAAVAEELTKKGLKVVGLARRSERIEELSKSLKSAKGKLYAVKADLTKEEDIKSAFKWITANVGGVDILVNNAGFNKPSTFADGPGEIWRNIIDLNVMALSYCTREALQSMKERGVDDGHIVNINSVAGHYIFNFPSLGMYIASKHAVTTLTESLRQELVRSNSKIRVTSVSPGLVKTEMPGEEYFVNNNPYLEAADVADAVLYALSVPPRVQRCRESHVNVTHQPVTPRPRRKTVL